MGLVRTCLAVRNKKKKKGEVMAMFGVYGKRWVEKDHQSFLSNEKFIIFNIKVFIINEKKSKLVDNQIVFVDFVEAC